MDVRIKIHVGRSAMVVAALAAGCAATPHQSTPTSAADPGNAGALVTSPSLARIEAVNQCLVTPERVFFHALFPVHYSSGLPEGAGDSRQVYQFDCSLADHTCEGVQLNLEGVDQGEGLGMMALGRAEGAMVVSSVGSVTVIRWGIFRSFTVDIAAGTVSFTESGNGMLGPIEGRGVAPCVSTSR